MKELEDFHGAREALVKRRDELRDELNKLNEVLGESAQAPPLPRWARAGRGDKWRRVVELLRKTPGLFVRDFPGDLHVVVYNMKAKGKLRAEMEMGRNRFFLVE